MKEIVKSLWLTVLGLTLMGLAAYFLVLPGMVGSHVDLRTHIKTGETKLHLIVFYAALLGVANGLAGLALLLDKAKWREEVWQLAGLLLSLCIYSGAHYRYAVVMALPNAPAWHKAHIALLVACPVIWATVSYVFMQKAKRKNHVIAPDS